MHSVWKTSIRFTLVTALLLGLGYPLFVTGIAAVIFPHKAAGSLISSRTARSSARSCWRRASPRTSTSIPAPRPPATATTPLPRADRIWPSPSKALVDRIQGYIDKLSAENPGKPVPIDLVTTSGSGLDPDITPDAAYFQAPRVAKARGISEDRIRQLIDQHIAKRQLGFLGEPRVNVLALNLDLDKLAK